MFGYTLTDTHTHTAKQNAETVWRGHRNVFRSTQCKSIQNELSKALFTLIANKAQIPKNLNAIKVMSKLRHFNSS